MVSKTLLSLTGLMWGIQNQGEPQRITIDHFTSGYVQGIRGEDIHLPPPLQSGVQPVIVAVLDTGVDASHPDLKDKLFGKGFNFTANTDDTSDLHGHGTHIAGIIAAQVSKNARILPVKVVQTGPNAPIRPQGIEPGAGTALTETVAKGIIYAIEQGARVINLSLAWPASIRSKAVDAAMKQAEEQDVIVVASAANDGTSANLYPCIYSNVICVGAHGPDGSMTYFTNHGSMVDLLAPGIAIVSTWPMNKAPVTFAGQVGYEFRNGTSMAAPFVSGAAAELLARGYSPKETKNRLLLSSRPTRDTTLYSTSVVGSFTTDLKNEKRVSRFGNLDVSNALLIQRRSLILPLEKERLSLEWNGTDSTLPVTLRWKNDWIAARSAEITLNGKTYRFESVLENQILETPISLRVDETTESAVELNATITTLEQDGSKIERSIPISMTITRIIRPDLRGPGIERYPVQGLKPDSATSVRSVVTLTKSDSHELLFVNPKGWALTRNGKLIGFSSSLGSLNVNSILNFYHLSEDRFALITTSSMPGETRPSFRISFFDAGLNQLEEFLLGTDTTVLNERLFWAKTQNAFTPLWISVGYTPATQKPKKDPWNPDPKDLKIPRIYYLDHQILKTIPLADDELPLQILPDGSILGIKGTSYFANYFLLMLDLTQPTPGIQRRDVTLSEYRMLMGLDASSKVLPLNGSTPDSLAFVGLSTPGNLRASILGPSGSLENHEMVLKRSNTLESLVLVSGVFSDSQKSYFFAQTHYDLKFFRSGSDQTHSLSLNRYSYIPSMIFSRNFFSTLVRNESGMGMPALYIPASLATGNLSEIIVGNPETGEVSKPAHLRLQAQGGCSAIGNLIPATQSEPAKLAFFCQNESEVLLVPLVVPSPF